GLITGQQPPGIRHALGHTDRHHPAADHSPAGKLDASVMPAASTPRMRPGIGMPGALTNLVRRHPAPTDDPSAAAGHPAARSTLRHSHQPPTALSPATVGLITSQQPPGI